MPKYIGLGVGEKFSYAAERQEGTFMLIDSSGITLLLNYNHVKPSEIEHWLNPIHDIEFRFVVKNGLFLLLAKVEGEQWIEFPYCPQIDDSYYLEPIHNDHQGYLTTMIITDKITTEIKGMRTFGLGNQFSKKLKYTLDSLIELEPELSVSDYYYRYGQLLNTYTTKDLVNYADSKYLLRGTTNK